MEVIDQLDDDEEEERRLLNELVLKANVIRSRLFDGIVEINLVVGSI